MMISEVSAYAKQCVSDCAVRVFSNPSRQCFLSRFWVSKWHPKFWNPRYGSALYWSKTIWRKHAFLNVAIATDGCNVIGRRNFLVQKLEAKIVRMVIVHCHTHRLASTCYYTAAELYSMLYETSKAF